MPQNRTHEQAVDALYYALVELMDEKPYDEISVTELVNRAQVSRMAYYRNYASIGDILLERYTRQMDELLGSILTAEGFCSPSNWKRFIIGIQTDPSLLYLNKAKITDSIIGFHKERAIEICRRLFLFPEDENDILAVYRHIGSLLGIIYYIIDNSGQVDVDYLAESIAEGLRRKYSGFLREHENPKE